MLLGASHARGVDVDPDAVEVTRENAARNGCSAALVADTTDVRDLEGSFGVVLANIEARVLIPLARRHHGARRAAGPARPLGVLAPDVVPQMEEVKAAYARFTLEAVERKGEWVAILLRAPG